MKDIQVQGEGECKGTETERYCMGSGEEGRLCDHGVGCMGL